MSEKTLNNIRIVNKHDTEENWLKATGFTPKQGEVIIYDIDSTHSYERSYPKKLGTAPLSRIKVSATLFNSRVVTPGATILPTSANVLDETAR